jgi:hypothetical protein
MPGLLYFGGAVNICGAALKKIQACDLLKDGQG